MPAGAAAAAAAARLDYPHIPSDAWPSSLSGCLPRSATPDAIAASSISFIATAWQMMIKACFLAGGRHVKPYVRAFFQIAVYQCGEGLFELSLQ